MRVADPKLPFSGATLGASFFFVRGDEHKGSARLLFPTLARQFASLPSLRSHIADGAQEYIKQGGRQQAKYIFEQLLHQPLTKASISPPAWVLLVLDALDECA
ncbi:uncharacterized protein PHACADRAFT_246017 [Phanerochaete carnosa HHB-10118-sp]|uniref:Nephrocystin 3-like N-terminal domain-containing protein n=1 Tax=Phanerochaete carnosa (strain HHB-10118-sp) TaxID=650164 RepID=K5VBA0_PHACS|nr:uncharacterized protein PHACADRAFT_246017 [Phanerochaete carnosa HHB-10118-sp]EKM60176.1 hypothetical protein PHACADRAFT_246017 [Phanerochaete carnosa HHB-10118-sp]